FSFPVLWRFVLHSCNSCRAVSSCPSLPYVQIRLLLRVLRILFHFCYGSRHQKSPMFAGLVTGVTDVTGFWKGVWVSLPILFAIASRRRRVLVLDSAFVRPVQIWICANRSEERRVGK